ncbi:MAG: glycosyltransferase [Anaerolineae bacterium]|nr:glycosyltransferase [Anaerolineae bacterium]
MLPYNLALVHDWLNQYGGAERVLEQLMDFFPGTPMYTSMYWRAGMPQLYQDWDIRTTWMDRLPGIYHHHQVYFPFYALAFARMDLSRSGYDLVLTNKSGFCHGVRTGQTPQLCYCLAPTRYVWEYEAYAAREQIPAPVKLALRPLIALLRRCDYAAAQRPNTHFVAISTEIQQRIQHYYNRDSVVITPPVDTRRFSPDVEHDDYYLIVSRLIPYKRIDLVIHAFNKLGLPLLVAGSGRDEAALRALAGPNITFLGRVPDADLPRLFARCKAFIFPGLEDFGLTPVEAQAAGRPVIAYGAGGALDTVVAGITGTFFYEATPESLAKVVSDFDVDAIDPQDCTRNAERFSVERFRAQIMRAISGLIESGDLAVPLELGYH